MATNRDAPDSASIRESSVFTSADLPCPGDPKIAMFHATLLDSCVACATQSTLEAGQGYTTLELKVNYIRALTDRVGPVRAEGRVIHVGKQIGTAEGKLVDADGKLYAHASTTCLIFNV